MFTAIAMFLAVAPGDVAPPTIDTFNPRTVELVQGPGGVELVALDGAGNVDGTFAVWRDDDGSVQAYTTWDDGWSHAVIRDGELESFAISGISEATLAERAEIMASLPGGGSEPIPSWAKCGGYILLGMAHGPSLGGAVYGTFAYCACVDALNEKFDWDLEEC